MPTRRPSIARRALVGALPGVCVLAVLALAGAVEPAPAALGAVAVVLSAVTVAWRDHDFRRRLADRLSANAPSAASEGSEVEAAVARLEAALAEAAKAKAALARGHQALLDRLVDPVLLLNRNETIVLANRAVRDLLGPDLVGRELTSAIRNPELLEAVEDTLRSGLPHDVEFTQTAPVAQEFLCRLAPLGGATVEGGSLVLVFQDLTQLKRVERMRADFVANASHEIRTPLAAIGGFIETLQGPAKDDAVARARFLATMAEQVARMTRLVGDLLSLSRIELIEHTPPADHLALAPILQRVVEGLEWRARARGSKVEVAVPEDLPPVVGDASELEQVFQNLIDNAIKYGADRGAVRVVVQRGRPPPDVAWPGRGEAAAVSVIDDGQGIARDHLPRLTERFYRVDTARSRALGGTGLGLAIVKHIVNRHRGVLTVESSPGRGSTFTVYLPLHAE